MRHLLVFLTLFTSLFASTIVTENDPSTLVEGVSVISGDLYTFEEDLVVPGKEPLRFRRSSISSIGNLSPFPHLVAVKMVAGDRFVVTEPNGTGIFYQASKQNKKKGPFRYDAAPFYESAPGVSNTSSGQISGQTNLKNQYLLVEPDGKRFKVHTSNSTLRYYRGFKNQKKVDLPFGGKGHLTYYYRLECEELPNGNKIKYEWNDKNELQGIATISPKGKRYASASFPQWDPAKPVSELTIGGSFGKKLSCRYGSLGGKLAIRSIASSDLPEQTFSHEVNKQRVDLRLYSLPNQRTLQIDYDDQGRVKTLSSRVGDDDRLITTHSFDYHPNERNSYVRDAQGNKTAYFWNTEFRLTTLEKFIGENELHSVESFVWDGAKIRCKTLLDQARKPIYSKTYKYDTDGNVEEETFHGNLSGNGSLQIGGDGLPASGETFSKKTRYERNLPVRQEENGLVTLWDYVPGTHLLKSKFLCDRDQIKIRHHYEYDDELILIRQIVDDGVARIVQEITPFRKGPFYGLAEIVEEKGNRKTVFHYGPDALIKQRDIYDADGIFQYSLKTEHDEKGRVLRETNSLGQEALSRYDEVGNKTFFKDFSGRLETHFTYDFSNRLTRKEEVGFDGFRRIFKYAYDTKHNLISEIDEWGNETKYIPTPFGERTETDLPLGAKVRQVCDSTGNEILRVDAEGFETKTSYNAYGKPALVLHPDGAEEKYTYFLDGSLKSYVDPKGVVTSYEYDYLGRVLRKRTADAQETYEYAGNFLLIKTDAEGNKTTYTYDQSGRKTEETFGGQTSKFSYDALGRVRRVQTGDLCKFTEYDLGDRIIEERRESLSGELLYKAAYEYDSAGNQTAEIDGNGAKTTSKYDSLNRLIEKTDPLGATETVAYDDLNVVQKTDALGLNTIETFDAQNRLARVEKRQGKTLAVEEKFYNKNNALTLQINTIFAPDGSFRKVNTRWEYDARGRVKTLIEADAKVTAKSYTTRGELERTVKPDGTTLHYTYNDLGFMTFLVSSDGTVHHEMRYNRLGHLIAFDGIERTVDARGRITSEILNGVALENRYDDMGRRVECRIPAANCLVEYEHNAARMMRVARKTSFGELLYTHRYTSHDLAGNLLGEELINGQNVSYNIDMLSRKTGLSTSGFNQEVLDYDRVGNILRMRIQQDECLYTYDPLYQLTSESGLFAHNYSYDSLYNRLQKDAETYQVNELQQIVSHLEYDKNGNPIRSGDSQYMFDALDRLIRIETPTFVQSFTYDFLNRCLTKTTAEGIRYFLYDGKNEIGSFDERRNITELRILGRAPHAEIGASIAVELQGSVFAPIHDLHGNIAALLPLDGSNFTFYRYSAFGEEKIEGPTTSPWRYSSKRSDETTGLVYYGRRFYSPPLGRWLTPDPVGFTDGMNLYAFVHNDPLTHVDEYGLTRMFYKPAEWDLSNPAPWRGTHSEFGNFLGAKLTHELYDYGYAPFASLREGFRSAFPSQNSSHFSTQPWHDRYLDERRGIDRFFGTNITNQELFRSEILERCNMRMQNMWLPPPGGGTALLGAAARTTNVARHSFDAVARLSKSRNLMSPKGFALTTRKLPSGAENINARMALAKKLSQLETAQHSAVKIQYLHDGRIRYYGNESPAITNGATRGRSYVTEFDPNTSQVRTWMECYTHSGKVNRVHPKQINGQDLLSPHYPPTASEIRIHE